MKRILSMFLALALVLGLVPASAVAADTGREGEIVLADAAGAAPIYIDEKGPAYDGLSLIAEAVAGDIAAVTGKTPAVVNEEPASGVMIVAGLVNEPLIKSLNLDWEISASNDDFKSPDWERYQIQIKKDGGKTMVVVAGSDKLGTIYGLFHITQDLCGVSPWIWWADAKPAHQDTLSFTAAELETTSKRPSVNFRGFFLNDENPVLDGFADSHFGGLNYMFYDHVFELMLRLKGNYLWPAMWSNNFNLDGMEGVTGKFAELEQEYHDKLGGVMYIDKHGNEDGIVDINALGGDKIDNGVGYLVEGEYPMYLANAVLADRYGIYVGASHHEPMARAGQEWGRFKGQYYNDPTDVKGDDVGVWNYLLNPTNISNFWSDSIARNGSFQNLLTIGMRGENDSPLKGEDGNPLSTEENTELLKKVLKKQDEILTKFGLANTPQLIALYKEVENCWYGGSRKDPSAAGDYALRNDPEVTSLLGKDTNRIVMLCEDNNGYLRTLPELDEKDRFNWGMYYHFDYVGGPRTSMWVNTMPLQRTWDNMTMAYDYGVDDAWIVNVGDLKPMELPLSYFMDMAYDFDKYGSSNPNSADEYTLEWVKQQFAGAKGLAEEDYQAMAQLLTDYADMNGQIKPETLRSSGDPSYSTVNYNEAQVHLAKAISIMDRADALLAKLPEGSALYDAFYQLIYYPAVASANVNRVQIFQGLNQLYAQRGSTLANAYADLVKEGLALDEALTAEYNTLGGDLNGKDKWYGMMWTTPDYVGKTPDGKDTKPHMNYQGWNAESAAKILPTYVEGTPGSTLMVDVPGSKDVYTDGATAVLPDFENIAKQAYAVVLSNGGNEALRYTITNENDWIVIDGAQEGQFYTGAALGVSIDWDKVTEDATGTFTITSGEQTVTVQVTAKVVDTAAASEKAYFPSNGEVVIPSDGYASSAQSTDGVEWTLLEGYGKTGDTMKMLPTHTASFAAGQGPWMEYQVYLPEGGDYRLTFYVGQSNNVSFDNGTHLDLGLAVDGGDVTTINALPKGYVAGDNGAAWGSSIMRAGRTVSVDLTLDAGNHTLRVYGMDQNLLLQKLVLTAGKTGPKDSFIGPTQTYRKDMGEVEQQELVTFTGWEQIMLLPGTIAAVDCTNEEVTDEGVLHAESGVSYTYPVKVTADGTFLFTLLGQSDASAEATLSIGGKSVNFALTGTQSVVEGDKTLDLTAGDYEATLTVTAGADITSFTGEIYDATEGRLVTLSGEGGDDAGLARAMDRKKSTSWQPTEADPSITLTLCETAYADHFTLTGDFSAVTGYTLEVSTDGEKWTTVYTSDSKPVNGQTVYFQGTQAFAGSQWRFSFTGTVTALSEIELHTYMNWSLADADKTFTTGGKDPNRLSSDPTKTADGNRIGHPKNKNGWIAEAGNLTITFDQNAHPMTGMYIVAMQDSVDSDQDGVIPTDTLASTKAPSAYHVSYQKDDGEWVDLGQISNGGSGGNKVLNYIEFAGGESVYVQAVKIDISGWVRVMEIEPVDLRSYTIGGTADGWPEDNKPITPAEPDADDPSALGYVDLAQMDGVTVALSGSYEGSGSDPDGKYGDRLIDGILEDDNSSRVRWEGKLITEDDPASLIVDLGSERDVSYIELVSQKNDNESAPLDRTLESTLTPSAMTFSYWDGSQWVEIDTVTENHKVWVQCKLDQSVTTQKIKVDFPAEAATSGYVRVFEVLVWGLEPVDEDLTNFALTGTVTVSQGEGTSDGSKVTALNDGDVTYNNGKRWRTNVLPAWVEVELAETQSIERVDVFSQMPDSAKVDGKYPTPTGVTETNLGLKDIELSYWNGAEWVKFATGDPENIYVRQSFTLDTPVETNKIRIDVPDKGATADTWVRLVEVQVWGNGSTQPVPETYTVTVEAEGQGDAHANVTKAKEGDTVTLTATPAEGWRFVEWKSDDVKVAEDGTFTMPAENVTVTAVFEQDVTKVQSITVSAPADTITKEGGTLQMTANVLPEDAADKSVTWTVETIEAKSEEPAETEQPAETEEPTTEEDTQVESETVETEQPAETEAVTLTELVPAEVSEPVEAADTVLATIDPETGLLTALAEGTVKVTATANDGSGVTGTMEITIDFDADPVVTYPIAVVVNEEGAGTAEANVTEAAEGVLVTLMQSAANGWHFVGWQSADVTVENDQFRMPGHAVTITAMFEKDKTISVTGVTLDRDSLRLEEGDSYTLTATVEPSDATNKAVTWSSSDTDVVTVDQNGRVLAKDPGTATITVTTENGEFTATCKVTVYEYDDGGSSSGGSSSRPEPRYDVEMDVTGGSVKLSNNSPKAGDRVTVTLRPDAGMELERIEVVTEDGDTVKLTKVDEDEYTFRQPSEDVTIQVVFTAVETEPEVEFGDVKDSDWFAAAVEYVVEKGLMQGVGADLFQPQGLTDRAMVVTILYRLEGEPAVTGGQSFPDVAPDTWYAEAVRWASSEGIVDGYADGAFGPTDPVTREQLAAILYRYAGKPVVEGESKTFADSANISSWAVEAMDWAVKSGVLSGKGGDLLDPTGTATRAEVAQILMNFCENVK